MANDKNLTEGSAQSAGGYRIAAIVLAVVVIAVSAIFIMNRQQMVADYEVLSSERNAIQLELTELSSDFSKLKTDNAELTKLLAVEKNRTDSLLSQIEADRKTNSNKIYRYERELGSLRATLKDYLAQIDSLNALNAELTAENVEYKKEVASQTARADKAEKDAADLAQRISEGARLLANDIEIIPYAKSGREKTRIKRAASIGVSFSLAPNVLTKAGLKEIYACITAPGGFVLTTEALPTFKVGGKDVAYSALREVDYQNEKLDVIIYYAANGFEKGTYKVDLYCDGAIIGSAETEEK